MSFRAMKLRLSILLASLSISGSLIPLSSSPVVSAEIPVFPSPVRIAQIDSQTQEDAKYWGNLLNGYQEDYRRKNGVFARRAEQILTVLDPKSYQFVINQVR
jgi:hypothetical protein